MLCYEFFTVISGIPPDPPTNVTILKSSCSSEMCSVLLSWDLPIYVNNETVYFVFIHHDEVNNTLIGENGKYLVEIEQRLSTKVLIVSFYAKQKHPRGC